MSSTGYMRVLSEQEFTSLQHQLRLSARQAEVVRLVAQGLSDRQIAEQLGISFGTVRTHMCRLFRKCNVKNRMQLLLHIYGRLFTP